jgi:hypothetical protein
MKRLPSVAEAHVRRLTRPGAPRQYPLRRMCDGPHRAGSPPARNVDEMILGACERDTVASVLISHDPADPADGAPYFHPRLAGGLSGGSS